ncbi:hypothetical protein HUG17_6364 [Dermatophagoides farinae]|uniref:Uncharacterized protein n=1 Tax=Dermatophagoides farinae TaxID=6954 RepID=A0A9D4SJA0_DERFA|nr:hypothetical protein HUG17_6364 [Dermatophagoides farinae]
MAKELKSEEQIVTDDNISKPIVNIDDKNGKQIIRMNGNLSMIKSSSTTTTTKTTIPADRNDCEETMSNTNNIKSNHRRQQQQQQLGNGKQIEQIIDDQRKKLVAKNIIEGNVQEIIMFMMI